jgi:hypothetical protein
MRKPMQPKQAASHGEKSRERNDMAIKREFFKLLTNDRRFHISVGDLMVINSDAPEYVTGH